MNDAEEELSRFLGECAASSIQMERVRCPGCNASRSIFCFDCCDVFIPQESWPSSLRNGTLRLPVAVDILLDDKRSAATGVGVAAMLQSAKLVEDNACNFRLIDFANGAPLPDDYGSSDATAPDEGTTHVLFPSKTSQPLSKVMAESKVKRLVLLDCKWTRSRVRLERLMTCLPHVHLDKQPMQSYYWRWHNAGEGMLSTVEALFFASWEAAKALHWKDAECKDLVHLLWIFGLQREVIRRKYEEDQGRELNPYLPFTEDGKQYHRALRMKNRDPSSSSST